MIQKKTPDLTTKPKIFSSKSSVQGSKLYSLFTYFI